MTFTDHADTLARIEGAGAVAKPRSAEKATSVFPKPQYLCVSRVKSLAKGKGRRVSAEFLHVLDLFIKHKIEKACVAHNGGKKTLDATIAGFVGIK